MEIGCGTGLLAYVLAKQNKNYRFIATDICQSFITKAAHDFARKNLRYCVLDFNNKKAISKILKETGKFDYIIGDGILHHLFNRLDDVAEDLKRLLKDNGKILFWEPNIVNPYCFLIFKFTYLRKMANLEPGEMAFSKGYLKNILQIKGYSEIKITNRDFLLPITPDFLINFALGAGNLIEKMPVVNRLSQSIFISAVKAR